MVGGTFVISELADVCTRILPPFDPSTTRSYLYTGISQIGKSSVPRPNIETSIVTLLAAIHESFELLGGNDTAQPFKVSLLFL